MKKIVINFHSIVDVITNSSTTIYVQCTDNTIKYAKELIDSLLKVAGSDKTANDLFEFKIVGNEDNEVDNMHEDLESHEKEIIKLGYTKKDIESEDTDLTWKIAGELFDGMNTGKIKKHNSWGENYDGYDTRKLIITAKNDDKFTFDLADKIQGIFEIDGSMG